MSTPLVIDLCCGLGGWTRGFLAEGWDCLGFDIEKHEYGDKRYPAELILKDIRQLCGYDLRAVNPVVIVASPPCQAYSYMAMPWKRAKEQAAQIRADETGAALKELNELFDTCFRIARECGVPLVVENVKGAQPWVGQARAHFGSYYLWGDVESVGGRIVGTRPQFGQSLRVAGRQKRDGRNFHAFENGLGSSPSFNGAEHETRGVATKDEGGSWFNQAHNTESGVGQNPVNGVKGMGGGWFTPNPEDRTPGHWKEGGCVTRCFNSKSDSRKAASAMIAEIPFDLAQWIARLFKPPLLTGDTVLEHNDFEIGTPQHLVE